MGGGSADSAQPFPDDGVISADGTFSYTFKSKPLGVSLGPAGKNTGIKVTKVKEPREPIEAGDVFVTLNGESVSKMPFKEIAEKLKNAHPPIQVLSFVPLYETGL